MIVSNTSPLHYLLLTGDVAILPVLYDRLAIPAAVRDELLHAGAPEAVREWMTRPPEWLEIHADPLASVPGLLRDVGEAQAIALALTLETPGILLDDRKARNVARREGLLVVGTLGVIEAAAELKLLDLHQSVSRLVNETNFRADPDLLQAILNRHR